MDFVCFERRLVIEVDGSQHAAARTDVERDAWLEREGFRVLRFWNNTVVQEIESVEATVFAALQQDAPSP